VRKKVGKRTFMNWEGRRSCRETKRRDFEKRAHGKGGLRPIRHHQVCNLRRLEAPNRYKGAKACSKPVKKASQVYLMNEKPLTSSWLEGSRGVCLIALLSYSSSSFAPCEGLFDRPPFARFLGLRLPKAVVLTCLSALVTFPFVPFSGVLRLKKPAGFIESGGTHFPSSGR